MKKTNLLPEQQIPTIKGPMASALVALILTGAAHAKEAADLVLYRGTASSRTLPMASPTAASIQDELAKPG